MATADVIDTLDFIMGLLGFLAIVASWGLYLLYQYKRTKNFRDKTSMEYCQFSLTYVDEKTNTLKVRTLMEKPGIDIFMQNQAGLDTLVRAAKKTTIEDGFIRLPREDDQQFALKLALNALSARYSDIFLKEALYGGDIEDGHNHVKSFAFGWTNEKYDEVIVSKLRVLVVEESLLRNFLDEDYVNSLKYENEMFNVRVRTMKLMAKHFEDKTGCVRTMRLGL